MGVVKELEELAKELDVPMKQITDQFNKEQRAIYSEHYGTFLIQVNYWALDKVKSKHNKNDIFIKSYVLKII